MRRAPQAAGASGADLSHAWWLHHFQVFLQAIVIVVGIVLPHVEDLKTKLLLGCVNALAAFLFRSYSTFDPVIALVRELHRARAAVSEYEAAAPVAAREDIVPAAAEALHVALEILQEYPRAEGEPVEGE